MADLALVAEEARRAIQVIAVAATATATSSSTLSSSSSASHGSGGSGGDREEEVWRLEAVRRWGELVGGANAAAAVGAGAGAGGGTDGSACVWSWRIFVTSRLCVPIPRSTEKPLLQVSDAGDDEVKKVEVQGGGVAG